MIKNKKHILVFDLDDTLYKEIDFLKSAYMEIATFLSTQLQLSRTSIYKELLNYYKNGQNAFESFLNSYNLNFISPQQLITMYRSHKPTLQLFEDTQIVLKRLKERAFKVGLVTDGRSLQQRQKIRALGLVGFFDDIIISEEFGTEKPNPKNFVFFEKAYGPNYRFVYIGDNTSKDFIAPNSLGWTTICLQDNGQNIHPQLPGLPASHRPMHIIGDFSKLELLLSNKTDC